jgi:CO/xanthine dehydrogenase FAD-binding subunit
MPDPAVAGVLAGPAVGASDFRYHRPRHPEEVDALLAEHGASARLLVGGTDLLVQVRAGHRRPAHVVDIADLGALSAITFEDGRLRVGASVPLRRVREHPVVRDRFAALEQGAASVGSLQIQSRATLVGNACNASPAADTSPAVLLYDAVVTIRSVNGRRDLPVAAFWTGPGRTVLEPGEWVEQLTLTDPGPHGSAYVKLGRTRGVDLALVAIACLVGEEDVRVSCASLAPTSRRIGSVESLLRADPVADDESLDRAIAAEIRPITDIRASAAYRLAMARVCTRRAWAAARQRGARGEIS